MTTKPRIGIGMPVRNGSRWIREALDSLVAQRFEDFELLITDNASTDETPGICAEYARRDPRIRVFTHDRDVGVVANYQTAFERSRAPYFMWASDDDAWSSDYLGELIRAHEARPGCAIATPRTVYRKADGPRIEMRDDPPATGTSPLENLETLHSYLCTSWMYGLFDAAILRRHYREMERYAWWGADLIWLSGLCLEYPLTGSSDAVIYKRRHPTSFAPNALGFAANNVRMMWHLSRMSLQHGSGLLGKARALGISWGNVGRVFGRRTVRRLVGGAGRAVRSRLRA